MCCLLQTYAVRELESSRAKVTDSTTKAEQFHYERYLIKHVPLPAVWPTHTPALCVVALGGGTVQKHSGWVKAAVQGNIQPMNKALINTEIVKVI